MKRAMRINAFVVVACLITLLGGASTQAGDGSAVKLPAPADAGLRTNSFAIGIDDKGIVNSILDAGNKKELLPKGRVCPVLSVTVDGKTIAPTAAQWSDKTLELSYDPIGVKAKVALVVKPTHITFELLSITPKEKVEMVVWGPFASTSDANPGVFTGLLWDEQFAIGLQCLNPKTMVTVKEQGEKGLEAHCRDYEQPRTSNAYNYNFTVSYPGADVIGSKIALFGCPPDQTLATIEAIELAENLPHVTYQAKWVKSLPGPAYLGFEFSEDTIDQFIKVALDSGIPYIYHPSPWQSWGHFEPKASQFPHGREGFKACVDKAHKAGVRIGAHTLSTFITADDAYVTPKPDPRLASSGSSPLTKEITEKDTILEVADGAAFSAPGQKRIIRLGEELVIFGKVVGSKPARLEGCARGTYGTKAQTHPGGQDVARLIVTDFFGTIFLGNRELNREIARRGAANCLEFGLDKYEFDGVEGTLSCGLEYSVPEYVQAWYEALGDKRGKVMLGGSGIDNYTHHIMDCVNWGEPWGATFRDGMLDYRFMRMEQYRKNLLPHMLGQYAAQTYAIAGNGRAELNRCRVEDIEWLMALRAGNDAGFSLTFTPDWEAYLRGHRVSPIESLMLPNISEITAAMHMWEAAHQAKAFAPELKKLIGERHGNFHLVENGPAAWTLYPIQVAEASLQKAKGTVHVNNPYDTAAVNFVIFNQTLPVSKIALNLPDNVSVPLDVELKSEEIVRYTGGNEATIYGRNWDKRRTVPIDPALLTLKKGPADVAVEWAADDKARLNVEIRLLGPAWQLAPGK